MRSRLVRVFFLIQVTLIFNSCSEDASVFEDDWPFSLECAEASYLSELYEHPSKGYRVMKPTGWLNDGDKEKNATGSFFMDSLSLDKISKGKTQAYHILAISEIELLDGYRAAHDEMLKRLEDDMSYASVKRHGEALLNGQRVSWFLTHSNETFVGEFENLMIMVKQEARSYFVLEIQAYNAPDYPKAISKYFCFLSSFRIR